MDSRSQLKAAFSEAQRVLQAFASDAAFTDRVAALVDAIVAALKSNHKVLICGNGGSLCDAAHFAEELTGRYRNDRRPYAAIACTDAGHITCAANDYGFDEVFARWVRALGQPGDVLVILSTSGNSPNCSQAAGAAGKELGLWISAAGARWGAS